jgi:hypothetical protein
VVLLIVVVVVDRVVVVLVKVKLDKVELVLDSAKSSTKDLSLPMFEIAINTMLSPKAYSNASHIGKGNNIGQVW